MYTCDVLRRLALFALASVFLVSCGSKRSHTNCPAGAAAGTSCSDGNVCNGDETCNDSGVCVAGTPPVLDDGNPCTTDTCDPVKGVTHTLLAAGKACSDGNVCNGDETCNDSGVCVAGTPPVLDDGNSCTVDSCDPALGVVHTPIAAGTSCADDDLCNGNETCNDSGKCVANTPPVLEDDNSCTADSCIPSTGVVHSPIPGCGVLPPDPATVAPPNDPTVVTDIANSTAFLYSGATPIQTGVAQETIEAMRVAIIRGTVKDQNGNPASGATITILGHAEYGQTISRADGMFDLAVNGGGPVTVNYQKDGYLPVQRQVQAPWRDYVWADEVRLVPYDTMISAIALGASTIQVARGNPVTDDDGTRQATVFFPPGTQASMVMPDGSTRPLAAMHVRATEYTVGLNGLKSMPAALPPTSAYTYAVELSVDEAMMAGATSVQFDRPVAFYVENFLGFAVGGIVPVGYYDRVKGVWVASDNGKVIQIVSITGGLADLDTNGDGAADDAATLAALGVTAEEQARLAATYAAGTSLWRVPITHFTPYDCNWPYGCSGGAEADATATCLVPDSESPTLSNPVPNPDCTDGSIIDCQNQGLREVDKVVGTPYTLRYSSTRVAGDKAERIITIPLSAAVVPSNVLSLEVMIEIAGRTIRRSFQPLPNQTYVFEWDGNDAYGRPVRGSTVASVTVGWAYQSVYLEPSARSGNRSFAAMWSGSDGGSLFVPVQTRAGAPKFWRTRRWTVTLSSWGTKATALGGWDLNIHHTYDFGRHRLLLGDGGESSVRHGVITRVAGKGSTTGYDGDGGPATEAYLAQPYGIAVDRNGLLFIADTGHLRIRRVGTDGIITTIAGTGTHGYSGDGGPATAAQLGEPSRIRIGPDGALYFVDYFDDNAGTHFYRIRRIGTDGIITTVAGSEATNGPRGDGGPATAATVYPSGLAIGADGTLFFTDYSSETIRRVGTDGIITTIAGTGATGYSGDGGPAAAATFNGLDPIAIGPDGSLFIGDGPTRIRRIGPDGIISTVAGTGIQSCGGDGGQAVATTFGYIVDIAIDADGSLLVVDWSCKRVRRIGPDGIIATVVGSGTQELTDGAPATAVGFYGPTTVTLGQDGKLFLVDSSRVYAVNLVFPGWRADTFPVASEDGSEVFEFDRNGRHLRTLDAVTGVTRYTFGYNTGGRLVSVTDSDGNVTTIEWTDATATAIVAPLGQRTALTPDENGYLATITNPANETQSYTYDPNGLMRTYTDPRSKVHTFLYDAQGRLYRDENPAGGWKDLVRTDRADGYTVSVTTALGHSTLHDVTQLSTGAERRTLTQPDGTATVSTEYTNGTKAITSPDGTISTIIQKPDPRFRMQSPVTSITRTTPSGLSLSVVESRTATLANSGDPLSATSLGQTVTVNGHAYSATYTAANRTTVSTTPAGRRTTTVLDDKGRITQLQPPGVNATSFEYDPQGRMQTMTQGSRTYSIVYDAQGYPQTMTDPLKRTVSFTYDQAGRVKTKTLPGNRTVVLDYYQSGNLKSLTPPGRLAHGFDYTAIDLTMSYTPPAASNTGLTSTTYSYDLGGALSGVLLPDESTIVPGYDQFGRLETVTSSRGTTSLGYDSAGRVETVTAPDTGLSYGYDGFLVTRETWSGAIAGTVSWTYDNDFRVWTTSVNGSSVTYQYDDDSLLTGVGALTIARYPETGRIRGSTLGTVTTSQGYNAYGELESFGASQGSTSLYSYTLTPDEVGRIHIKTEMVQGTTATYVYEYDDAGRLYTVTKNSVQIASYLYDANGNRYQKSSSAGTETGNYDDQDRMYAYGAASYTYRPNGELATKTVSGQTTSYDYDQFGNLRGVVLPDGMSIEYVIDGQNRRIGKKVNGALAEGFLYEGQLRPVAWLDGTGTVVARFVYGTRVNVPEYMVVGSTTYRIITDHLGSPRLVIDTTSGVVAQRIDYDEWGMVLADSNPGFQPFGFAGGLYDRDTGLVRFGARDYDPQTGRWTNKDPIRFAGGLNIYEYVSGDPVNWIDPTGRIWLNVGMGMVGGLTNLAGAYLSNDSLTWQEGLTAFGMGFAEGFLVPFVPGSRAWRAGVGAVIGAGEYLLGTPRCERTAAGFATSAILGGVGGAVGEMERGLSGREMMINAVKVKNVIKDVVTSWGKNAFELE